MLHSELAYEMHGMELVAHLDEDEDEDSCAKFDHSVPDESAYQSCVVYRYWHFHICCILLYSSLASVGVIDEQTF